MAMEPIEEKRQALDRAREMISRGNIDELRYVALELRRCIEAVVYEKLWIYRDQFPAEVARRWQPPQAFKALLVMEPGAEHTKTVRMAKQTELGVPSSSPVLNVGTDQRFSLKWLDTTYNKLGSYLHASWPFAKNPEKASIETGQKFLHQVADDMERFVSRSFTSIGAVLENFQCSVCGTAIKANAAGLEQAREVTCLNPECGCRYFATKEENEFIFQLDALTATCTKCQRDIHIPAQKLKVGYRFPCGGCSQQYVVVDQQWQVRELDNEG